MADNEIRWMYQDDEDGTRVILCLFGRLIEMRPLDEAAAGELVRDLRGRLTRFMEKETMR